MVDAIKEILLDDKIMDEIIKTSFKIIDKDNSGGIDMEELEQVMNRICSDIGGDAPTKEEIEKVFNTLDTDHNNKIDEEEFGLLIRDLLLSMVKEDNEDEINEPNQQQK